MTPIHERWLHLGVKFAPYLDRKYTGDTDIKSFEINVYEKIKKINKNMKLTKQKNLVLFNKFAVQNVGKFAKDVKIMTKNNAHAPPPTSFCRISCGLKGGC